MHEVIHGMYENDPREVEQEQDHRIFIRSRTGATTRPPDPWTYHRK